MKQLNFVGGAAWFDKKNNLVAIGAGYDPIELNPREIVKLIAFLAKALARLK